jgi:4-coumarate--CoA ligase
MPPLERIYSSSYAPPVIPTNISISQLLQRYNPDDADANKIIVEDDWTGRTLTYAGLREQSAKGAYGLRHVLGVQEGDVVCICAPNSVRICPAMVISSHEP